MPGLQGQSGARLTGTEIAALAASLLWLLLAGSHLMLGGGSAEGGIGLLLGLMLLVMPVGLIWVAALALRAMHVMRAESARLQTAIDALRQAYIAQTQGGKGEAPHPVLMKRLEEIAGAQRNFEAILAMVGGVRTGEAPAAIAGTAQAAEDQPALSLGTPAEAARPPLSRADFIRALHFPETAEDRAGFAALRRALKDRSAAKLIQAAQDVLTLLSEHGVYMDDLSPDMARPEVWRSFAQGARGRAIAGLGGIHDRSALALAATRMKEDPIFRDAAHHFLRRFDQQFTAFAAQATDEEISAFAMTRTARAFMILGRVAGTFD
jgi:hypothetical protein